MASLGFHGKNMFCALQKTLRMVEGLRPSMLEEPNQEKINTSYTHYLNTLKHDFSTMEKYINSLPLREGLSAPLELPPSVFMVLF